ncbi:MAG: hypothetical protein KJ749_15525, partial [Planctomycetes bacterium]|nr:hypothetical protein [Planctomycetota bacterium]
MKWPTFVLSSAVLLVGACQSHVIDGADRQVYRLIEDRQRATLGSTSDAYIGPESGHLSASERVYSFAPRPVESGLAEPFQPAEQASPVDEVSGETVASEDEPDPSAVLERTPDIFPPDMLPQVETPGLREVLAYAMRHGRDLQYAKESLYLQALALALERHEWTPRLSAAFGVDAESRDAGGVIDDTGESDNERTMAATSGVEVAQKLPYGATITTKLANELGRDLERHAVIGETGPLSLEATIPLLTGAG